LDEDLPEHWVDCRSLRGLNQQVLLALVLNKDWVGQRFAQGPLTLRLPPDWRVSAEKRVLVLVLGVLVFDIDEKTVPLLVLLVNQ
jgi:hypothetical protein